MKTCFDCKHRRLAKRNCNFYYQDETTGIYPGAIAWANECNFFTYTPNTANHYRLGIERLFEPGAQS